MQSSSTSRVFLTQPSPCRVRGASPQPHPSHGAFPMVLESSPRVGITAKPTKPWRAWKGAKERDGKNSQFQVPEKTMRHNKALFGSGISLGKRGEGWTGCGENFSPSHIQSSTPIIQWKPKIFHIQRPHFGAENSLSRQSPGAADSKCWELHWDGAGAAKRPETGKPSCLIQRDFPWET